MDLVTRNRISDLHPLVRKEMILIIDACNKALSKKAQVRISEGLRTFAEQDALYKKRPKVTNARGGQSVHNFGFAVDIVLIIDGKTASWDTHKDWDQDGIADWDECVKIFAKFGWSWGGNWSTFKDMPHFDKIGYNNWRVLATKKRDTNNYIII